MLTQRIELAVWEATRIGAGVVAPSTADVARTAGVTVDRARRVLHAARRRGVVEGPPWVVTIRDARKGRIGLAKLREQVKP